MGTPSVLKKLGDKAQDYASTLKSLPPNENEMQALHEKNEQVNAVAPQGTVQSTPRGLQPITLVPAPVDFVSPRQGPYGSREGEVRYAVDKDGNITPIPMEHLLEEHKDLQNYQTLKPIEPMEKEAPIMKKEIPSSLMQPLVSTAIPVYDKGGDVKEKPTMEVHGDEKEKPTMEVHGDEKEKPTMEVHGDEKEKPTMEVHGDRPTLASIYDDGGDVDVNDGQHQVAILKEGEKVLTPEEAKQYKAEHQEEEHGAPADFAGRVLPNPQGLKPVLDTEIQKKSDTDNIPKNYLDISNPPDSKVSPETGREINNTLQPYSKVIEDRAKEHAATMQPVVQQTTEKPQEQIEEKPQLTMGHVLANQWLSKVIPPPPAVPEQPLAERQGPGLSPIVPAAPLTGKAAFHQKMNQYKADYQDALDRAAKSNDPADAEQAGRIKQTMLNYEKEHGWGTPESAHPGLLGKLGHIGERIAARTPVLGLSALVSTLPGSEADRARQLAGAKEEIKESSAENAAQTKATGVPKPFPGDNLRTAADGTREHLYNNPDGSTQWVKEGEAPVWPPKSPITSEKPSTGVPVPSATIGTMPSVPAAVNNATKDNPQYVYGKPPVPKEGEQPATDAQVSDVNTRLKNNPYVSPEAAEALKFPENYKPTQNDVKERLANIKEIEDATRAGKQDEVLNGIRKMQEDNQRLMTQAHLLDMQDKHQQAEAKAATNASVMLAGLYAQENYSDAMKKWYASGNFATDSGLITEIVNKEHSAKGAFSGAAGDALVGSIFGPEGAAIGAGIGALTGLFEGPANGYLDTLKKQGISQEGYDAMQSYFNALPARMAYEVSVQGVSATALRSAQLIQKVLNTIPPPNTPEESFDRAFNNYYKPMEILTKGKVELIKPKNYVAPKKSDFYPPETLKKTTPKYSANNPFAKKTETKPQQ